MQFFQKAVKDELTAVNDLILAQLESNVGLVENICHYIVDAGGKRLRPVVVLLSSLANGYEGPDHVRICLLYTSPSPRDGLLSRMPSSA